jgi:hypothetical protein
VLLHAAKEGDRSANIDTVVFEGDFARFANGLEQMLAASEQGFGIAYLQSCEVDDAVDIGIFREDLLQSLLICNVDLVEIWSLSAQEFNAIERDYRRVIQTIDDDDFIAMLEESERSEGANIAGASMPVTISISSVLGLVGLCFLQPLHMYSGATITMWDFLTRLSRQFRHSFWLIGLFDED